MATQTQLQMDMAAGCIHEQVLQAAYVRQRRRIRNLCQWMLAEGEAARRLEFCVFVEAWRRGNAVGGEGATAYGVWPRADDDRLAASFAAHFRRLFHAESGREMSAATPYAQKYGLRNAIQMLPAPQRLLYLLHELEGYAPATLGAWLDLEPSYCSHMIHAARQQLARSLAMAA